MFHQIHDRFGFPQERVIVPEHGGQQYAYHELQLVDVLLELH
nr:MAG: hypothetical protein [Bacteriophage sp.]